MSVFNSSNSFSDTFPRQTEHFSALYFNFQNMMHMITHRQCTTVRPSPHSLCHLCTWASRLRKAFLESGTSRYADQRRNWNWHTTSWPSWSFKYNTKHKTHGIFKCTALCGPSCSHTSDLCYIYWLFQYFCMCQLTPVFECSPGCVLAFSAVLTQQTGFEIYGSAGASGAQALCVRGPNVFITLSRRISPNT